MSGPAMLKISEIRIPRLMERKGVPEHAVADATAMLQDLGPAGHGVVVSDCGWLVDGYDTYLAAKRLGLAEIQGWRDRSLEAACRIAHREPLLFCLDRTGDVFGVEVHIAKAGKIVPGQAILTKDLLRGGYKILTAWTLEPRPSGDAVRKRRYQFIAALPFHKKLPPGRAWKP